MKDATVKVGGTETFAALYDETGNGNSVNFTGCAGGGCIPFPLADASLSYAGNISGNRITHLGTDTLILSGSNSYTGGTSSPAARSPSLPPALLPEGGAFLSATAATCSLGRRWSLSPLISNPSTAASSAEAVPEPGSLTLLLALAACAAARGCGDEQLAGL